jgi:hypothetical protein
LGTPADSYPIDDYQLVIPDTEDVVDSVGWRSSFTPCGVPEDSNAPIIYNVAVTFAYDGLSWDIRLRYDVSFISATPCHSGPHVLFYDYAYQAIKVDALLELEGWGATTKATAKSFSSSEDSSFGCQSAPLRTKEEQVDEEDKVLVVEAFGVPDNEVCARAWCAHFGLSAVTANIQRLAWLALYEAYAARVNMVILTEGRRRMKRWNRSIDVLVGASLLIHEVAQAALPARFRTWVYVIAFVTISCSADTAQPRRRPLLSTTLSWLCLRRNELRFRLGSVGCQDLDRSAALYEVRISTDCVMFGRCLPFLSSVCCLELGHQSQILKSDSWSSRLFRKCMDAIRWSLTNFRSTESFVRLFWSGKPCMES